MHRTVTILLGCVLGAILALSWSGCGESTDDGGLVAGPGGGTDDQITEVTVHQFAVNAFYQSLSDETRFLATAERVAVGQLTGEPIVHIAPGAKVDVRIAIDGSLRLAEAVTSLTMSVNIGGVGVNFTQDVTIDSVTVTQTGAWGPVQVLSALVHRDQNDADVATGFSFFLAPDVVVGDEMSDLRIQFTVPDQLQSGAAIGPLDTLYVRNIGHVATQAGDQTGSAPPVQPGL